MKYRIHLLALPNAPTMRKYSLDGFSQATIRFARMMVSLGNEVFLYGAEGNEAPCTEFIPIITDEERLTFLNGCEYQYAYIDERSPLWQLANLRMIREVTKRKQPRDFLCVIGGASQKPVADAHPDLMCVEYSIGYQGSFSPYRVFESCAWRHTTYGFQNTDDGRFFDTVIPVFFDPDEFLYNAAPEDFVLYVGRIIPRKGVGIACAAAHAAGFPLKVIGHGDPKLLTHGAEYLGPLGMEERNEYMSRARAVLCPTQYIEPFCCVAAEAQMCGTPVISTDFGGFTETVEHSVSGFRCNYLGEFSRAIGDCGLLDREKIWLRALDKYSMHVIKNKYQEYFDRLSLLWGAGWNTID